MMRNDVRWNYSGNWLKMIEEIQTSFTKIENKEKSEL